MEGQPFGEPPDIERALMELVGQVPPGRVSTYGSLAEELGNPVAARWIGHFLMHHDHSTECVCHRIVRADGTLGQYIAGGTEAKAARLASEGVETGAGMINLPRYRYNRFRSTRPLHRLTQIQEDIAARVSLRGRRTPPKQVAGVDVSYTASGEGVAAYALVAYETGELLWTTTIRRAVHFPYITSYLSFREIPLLLDLLETVATAGQSADLLLVDGSGVLHPRGAGIAAHIGVIASVPTVGVTKKILCGRADLNEIRPLESRPVAHKGRCLGLAIRSTAGSHRPIFISPGHRVSLSMAETVVRHLLRGRRLPEPLYWADRLSRSNARGCF